MDENLNPSADELVSGAGGDIPLENTGSGAVEVTNWPSGVTEQQYELVELPSGTIVRVDRHVTYGELLVAAVMTLLLVVQVGRWLFDRIRGVL